MLIKVDSREHELVPKIKNLIDTLPAFKDIQMEVSSLPLADIVFCKEGKDIWFVERKCIQDLAASIKDGRYEEQSYRLNGLPVHNHNIVYLIEGNIQQQGQNSFKDRIDKFTLYSALFSLNYYKGFSVLRTLSIDETALFLCNCANKLRKTTDKEAFYKSKYDSSVVSTGDEEEGKEGEKNEEKHEEPSDKDYVSVVKKVKKDNITPDNIGEIMLSQIPGISSVTAIAIMNHFKTFHDLIQQCKNNEQCLKEVSYVNEKGQTRKLNKTCIQNLLDFLVKR
jgi:crossover junction endonuclease MUS81